MLKLKIFLALFLSFTVTGCVFTRAELSMETKANYEWSLAVEKAAFPPGYGFPVFVIKDKTYAFHHEGVWNSADGVKWAKTRLPSIRREANETRYVRFNNA